jgi:hypothetical protein
MNFLEKLISKTDAYKKYKANEEDIKSSCQILVKCFDAFNSMNEDDLIFRPWNRPINDIPIPQELSFYIMPSAVRWNPLDRKTKDVLFKKVDKILVVEVVKEKVMDDKGNEVKGEDGKALEKEVKKCRDVSFGDVDYDLHFPVSYDKYINALVTFRGFFKKEGLIDTVSLSSLRKSLSLYDVVSKSCSNERAHYYSDIPFWPIPIKNDVFKLFEDSFLNVELETLKEDFIANLRF